MSIVTAELLREVVREHGSMTTQEILNYFRAKEFEIYPSTILRLLGAAQLHVVGDQTWSVLEDDPTHVFLQTA